MSEDLKAIFQDFPSFASRSVLSLLSSNPYPPTLPSVPSQPFEIAKLSTPCTSAHVIPGTCHPPSSLPTA